MLATAALYGGGMHPDIEPWDAWHAGERVHEDVVNGSTHPEKDAARCCGSLGA
jgi:hypothetical protein